MFVSPQETEGEVCTHALESSGQGKTGALRPGCTRMQDVGLMHADESSLSDDARFAFPGSNLTPGTPLIR